MEKMPISPFQRAQILDGNWISGFTDGEGCFYLAQRERKQGNKINLSCECQFQITLRNDDIEVLYDIQHTLGCGGVDQQKRKLNGNSKPCAGYRVNVLRDLVEKIIPHFEEHPLRSKKQRDFNIWKQAVRLAWDVNKRTVNEFGRKVRTVGRRNWSTEELVEFNCFIHLLRLTREYSIASITI